MQTEFLVYFYLGVPAMIWFAYGLVYFARRYRSRSAIYTRLFGRSEQ
jgi:hypothetical protein